MSQEIPDELLQYSKDLYYTKKSMIFMQNDPPERIFYLKEGKVCHSYYSKEGERKIIIYIQKGGIFGETAILLNQKAYGITTSATTNCLVAAFTRKTFEDILMKDTDFLRFCLQEAAKKIRMMGSQIISLAFLTCEKRVINSLLWFIEYAIKSKDLKEDQKEYVIRMTHQELGELASVHRVAVTNVLNTLEKEKSIHKKAKTIIVPLDKKQKLKQLI